MAVLAGLLFVLLGSHTESVSWVSGRTDLIAAAFGLASTVLFLRGSFVSPLLLVIALLSKESAVVLPGVWMLLMPWAKGNRALRWILASGMLLALVYILFRFMSGDVSGNLSEAGGETAPLKVAGNLFRYFFRVFIPPCPVPSGPSWKPFACSSCVCPSVVRCGTHSPSEEKHGECKAGPPSGGDVPCFPRAGGIHVCVPVRHTI